ncbi:MAG: hypothetical protein M1838_002717 [Thelocarpon superellum]|nr:MAG: hypothetical protein M1838_002717 [Thelocarpon superellum]
MATVTRLLRTGLLALGVVSTTAQAVGQACAIVEVQEIVYNSIYNINQNFDGNAVINLGDNIYYTCASSPSYISTLVIASTSTSTITVTTTATAAATGTAVGTATDTTTATGTGGPTPSSFRILASAIDPNVASDTIVNIPVGEGSGNELTIGGGTIPTTFTLDPSGQLLDAAGNVIYLAAATPLGRRDLLGRAKRQATASSSAEGFFVSLDTSVPPGGQSVTLISQGGIDLTLSGAFSSFSIAICGNDITIELQVFALQSPLPPQCFAITFQLAPHIGEWITYFNCHSIDVRRLFRRRLYHPRLLRRRIFGHGLIRRRLYHLRLLRRRIFGHGLLRRRFFHYRLLRRRFFHHRLLRRRIFGHGLLRRRFFHYRLLRRRFFHYRLLRRWFFHQRLLRRRIFGHGLLRRRLYHHRLLRRRFFHYRLLRRWFFHHRLLRRRFFHHRLIRRRLYFRGLFCQQCRNLILRILFINFYVYVTDIFWCFINRVHFFVGAYYLEHIRNNIQCFVSVYNVISIYGTNDFHYLIGVEHVVSSHDINNLQYHVSVNYVVVVVIVVIVVFVVIVVIVIIIIKYYIICHRYPSDVHSYWLYDPVHLNLRRLPNRRRIGLQSGRGWLVPAGLFHERQQQ